MHDAVAVSVSSRSDARSRECPLRGESCLVVAIVLKRKVYRVALFAAYCPSPWVPRAPPCVCVAHEERRHLRRDQVEDN